MGKFEPRYHKAPKPMVIYLGMAGMTPETPSNVENFIMILSGAFSPPPGISVYKTD